MKFDASEIAGILAEPAHILALLDSPMPNSGGWLARCPVHPDKTPSCRVNVRNGKAYWRCWACGAWGDVLDLLRALEGLPFAQALLRLGAKPLDPKARPITEDERMARVFVPKAPWETVTEPTLFSCDCSMWRVDPSPMPARWRLRRHYSRDLCGRCAT